MTELELLKQYIADAVVWVPVWTALISLLSAWGGVWLNNYLQGRYRQKIDSRRERKWPPSLSKYFLIANQEGTEKINGHPISARKEKSNPRENPFQGDYG